MSIIGRNSNGSVPSMKLLGILVIVCLCGVAMVPAVAATASPSASATSDRWSGTWKTAGSTPIASQTIGVLTLTRTGSSVTGTFTNNDQGKGTISGTVSGNALTGTWSVDYGTDSDTGSFKFVLSDNKDSFTGTWVSASDKVDTLSTSPEFWNGAR